MFADVNLSSNGDSFGNNIPNFSGFASDELETQSITHHPTIPPESPSIHSLHLSSNQFDSPLQLSHPSSLHLPSPQFNSPLHPSPSLSNPRPSPPNSPVPSSGLLQTQLDSPILLQRSRRTNYPSPRTTSTSYTHNHNDNIDGPIKTCSKCNNLFSPSPLPRPFGYAKQPGVGVGHGYKTKQYCLRDSEEDEIIEESFSSEVDEDSDYQP
jgi:hypothetical protein